MARACIVNVYNRGKLLLDKLLVEGRIDIYEFMNDSRICFEFSKKLRIDIEDYKKVVPQHLYRNEAMLRMFIEDFKKYIVLPILNTVSGARIVSFDEKHVELEPTTRTVTICFRVSREEKERLEEEAKRAGKTLSDYIREKLLGTA